MGQQALVHFAAPWEMTDESTGKHSRGFSLQFLTMYNETRDGSVGIQSIKTSIRDEEVFNAIRKHIPCMCELVIEAKPGVQGKLSAVVTGMLSPRPVKLFAPAS